MNIKHAAGLPELVTSFSSSFFYYILSQIFFPDCPFSNFVIIFSHRLKMMFPKIRVKRGRGEGRNEHWR